MRLVVDTETNGLLDDLDTIHCIIAYDPDADRLYQSNNHDEFSNEDMVELLNAADELVMHNGISFDVPALTKVYPQFKPKGRVRDTLVMARLMFPEVRHSDFQLIKKRPDFDKQSIGAHTLKAWGMRLDEWKGDYAEEMKAKGLDPWAEWSQEMQDYCVQDVRVTTKLWRHLLAQEFSEESIELEHAVYRILRRQEAYGFLFDKEAGRKLEGVLVARRAELAAELQLAFPPWEVVTKRTHIPKRSNKKKGWEKGVPVEITKTKEIVFNPGSRMHIADRLGSKYGWKPDQFTDKGQPKIDEAVLKKLPYPEASLLSEYLMVEKRLGQLSEGKEAWFKSIKEDGRIHGRVNTNGAVTGRMTHSKPNMAQVPKVGSTYGAECRGLFCVPAGKAQVGADASGLELRDLAHYIARYDGGAYAESVINGNSADETDVHSITCKALGMEPQRVYSVNGKQAKGRDIAKTFIYALLYGAGPAKLAKILGKKPKQGAQIKKSFLDRLPALGKLLEAIERRTTSAGYLRGLDGRKLYVRSPHAALNTLLQGAGAIVMKKALVILDTNLQEAGLIPGSDYEFVANVHDEWQIECNIDVAEMIGKAAVAAITAAGEHFNFRCPLAGEYKIGRNWAETH